MTTAPTLTYIAAVRLAAGCHDYGGGYSDPQQAEAFHAGISTVVNVLRKAAVDWDTQTDAVYAAGAVEVAP